MCKALIKAFLATALLTILVQCFVFLIPPWEFTEAMRAFLCLITSAGVVVRAAIGDIIHR